MKKNLQKGFTLIELLVVIAIIGILASVVLASLNSARTKGADAAVKANMANARAAAELFYDTGNTYTGVCGATGILPMLTAAMGAGSGTSIVTNGVTQIATTVNCNTNGTAWAASAPLKTTGTTSYYCVDSAGSSKTTTVLITATYVCP